MRLFISVLFCLIFTSKLYSCDICGCANGFSFMGIMPQSNRSFVGLRYKYFSFNSHPNSVYLKSQETFQQTEFQFRIFPFAKFQLVGNIPYSFHQKSTFDKKFTLSGLSDPSLLGNYNILNTLVGEKNRLINHVLSIGLGLKFPLGKYELNQQNSDEINIPNFQLGTGTWDYFISTSYSLKYKRLGWSTDIQSRQNGINSNQYQFGNRSQISSNLFYQVYLNNGMQIFPMLNYSFENWEKDDENGIVNNESGGQIQWIGFGTEITKSRYGVQVMCQLPTNQNLVLGELEAQPRLNVQVNYLF